MRKVIVQAFVSLDGVMQAPGAPEEDPTGGFKYGGWTFPYADETIGAAIGESFSKPFDLLLGRRTYDIFAAYWPYFDTDPGSSGFDKLSADVAERFNAVTKYVATHRPDTLTWQNSQSLGNDVAASIRELKKQDRPDLVVQGSTELIQILLANDLVDEIRLLIYPVVFGKGKRAFGNNSIPAAYKLTRSVASQSGVLIASYERAGDIKTGSYATGTPSEAEIERRKSLK